MKYKEFKREVEGMGFDFISLMDCVRVEGDGDDFLSIRKSETYKFSNYCRSFSELHEEKRKNFLIWRSNLLEPR